MKQTTIILSVILIIILSGCFFPNYATYYQPSADGGKVQKQSCIPVQSRINFTFNNLTMRCFTNPSKGKMGYSYVILWFPRGSWKKFHFTSADFQLYDLDKKTPIHATISISPNRGKGPYYNNKTNKHGVKMAIQVSIRIKVNGSLPDNFKLLSPSIVSDGEKIKIPPIEFKHKQWVGISPFNC